MTKNESSSRRTIHCGRHNKSVWGECDECEKELTAHAEYIAGINKKVQHCGYCSEGYDGKCDGVFTSESVAAEAAAEALILRSDKRKLEAELKHSEKKVKEWYTRCRKAEADRDKLDLEIEGLSESVGKYMLEINYLQKQRICPECNKLLPPLSL